MAELPLQKLKSTLIPGTRLLGFDPGTKTIGLALSDTRLQIASPLLTLRRRKLSVNVAEIKALIDEHGIGGLVIGLPVNMDGSEGPRAQSARQLGRNLEKEIALPYALWDERLSTLAVDRVLLDADSSRKRRAELVDKMAASYILQGALDWLRFNPPSP